MRNHYCMKVKWSFNDQLYVSEVPALPGCMSDGKTLEELFINTDTIIDEWKATAETLNIIVPEEDGKNTDNPLENIIVGKCKASA